MSQIGFGRVLTASVVFAAAWLIGGRAWSQTETAPSSAAAADSNYVKLLKKAPESRLGTIIEVIGKRGDANDLTYLLQRTIASAPSGFSGTPRRLALEALADAASTRNIKPSSGQEGLNRLIAVGPEVDAASRLASIRLAGVWRSPSSVAALVGVGGAKAGVDPAARIEAFNALATIGTDPARAALERFAGPSASPEVRRLAVAALARVDIDAAADLAAEAIAAASPNQDLAPLVSAFLDRQGGSDKLLAALNRRPPSSDAAKLALRAISALGRSDEPLVAALNKIAGIEGDPKPPTPSEMATLIADVARKGDPVRGERVFRRAEINCMKCHAIAGAAGGVGPELSALGLSSPVDYIVNSILIPDQAIKEEYETRVVLTDDGRVLQGIVLEENDHSVVLKDALGERRVIPTSSIEESKKGGSLMPKGLVGILTRGEFVDLVRYLSELGRPGPYAIRATPTIQRWRELRPVPPPLVESDSPSPSVIQSEILEADSSRWAPVYAWTSGDLPADDLFEPGGASVAVVQGEVTVSAAGSVRFRFGSGSRPEVKAWVDDQPIAIEADGSAPVALSTGTRRLTVRYDSKNKPKLARSIRVEVIRVDGSSAEFSVVGGR